MGCCLAPSQRIRDPARVAKCSRFDGPQVREHARHSGQKGLADASSGDQSELMRHSPLLELLAPELLKPGSLFKESGSEEPEETLRTDRLFRSFKRSR